MTTGHLFVIGPSQLKRWNGCLPLLRFSQLNGKKAPGTSSTLVLAASHSSSQPHQVFILRLKCVCELQVWRQWFVRPAFQYSQAQEHPKGTRIRLKKDRIISGTVLPRTRFDPISHAGTRGARAGSVCPSGEHNCEISDDNLASPNRTWASRRKSDPKAWSGVGPAGRVLSLEVRRTSIGDVCRVLRRLQRTSCRCHVKLSYGPTRGARSPTAGQLALLVRPGI